MYFSKVLNNQAMGSTVFTVVSTVVDVSNKGRRQAVTKTEAPAIGLIQPLPGKEAELLPEGEREKEAIVIFTQTPLSPAPEQDNSGEGQEGNRILHNGKTYRVLLVEEWQAFGGIHYRATAVLEGA